MNTCPCIESVKKFVTTGKGESDGCECCQKFPLSHLIIAGVAGLVLATIMSVLFFCSRRRD